MKAALLTSLRHLVIADVPEPSLQRDGDVLLRVDRVGVCGSDVHYYLQGRIGSQVVRYPYRVGHEFAGTVEAVGPAVTRVRVGDCVAVEPAMSCHACDQCRAGRPHTCRQLRFLGCPGQAEGCLCERVVMPEACCFPTRPGTPPDHAALAEPLSIGLYATRLAGSMQGRSVGILGCGPIGLSVLLAARLAGAERVYATDPIEARAAAARAHGAGWTGSPETEDIVRAVQAREPLGLDLVFDCCGKPAALDQGVELLKPGGTLLLVGIPEEDRVSFSIDKLRRGELRIQNVRRQNACMQPVLDMIEMDGLDPDFMITHRFPLADTAAAFECVAGYRDGVIKAMIDVQHR